MEVEVIRNEKFKILYEDNEEVEIIICIGGRGGAKTYEVSLAGAFNALVKNKRIQVLRDEKAHIKESILNEILTRFDTANCEGAFDGLFERQIGGLKNVQTEEMQIFTKGFRASSNSQRANLKSISNVDIAIIEEAEDIRDEDKFNTFADSIRKKGSYIIIVLNTPDINHWVVKRYFNLLPTEYDGYFKLDPKKIKGVEYIMTSFEDNKHLQPKTVQKYKDYGNPESHLYNLHYYLTSILGYASTGLKGQIFKNYKIITQEAFNDVDKLEVIGLDFGTSSPAGIVAVKIDRNRIYLNELNYIGLNLKDLAIKLNTLGFDNKTLIIADSAEPETIRSLRYGIGNILSEKEKEVYKFASSGFHNMRPAKKGSGSIQSGIDKLLSFEIYVTETSNNLLNELLMYRWAVDRNNIPMDVPIDDCNHLIDPSRYVVQMKDVLF